MRLGNSVAPAMAEGFAKDSRACAACISWTGERTLSHACTLATVNTRQQPGNCRAPNSPNYRKSTRAFHTCAAWAVMEMLRAHGGRPDLPVRGGPERPASDRGVPERVIVERRVSSDSGRSPTSGPSKAAPPAELPRFQSRRFPLERCPEPMRALLDYWQAKAGGRQIPDRRRILPWEIRHLLGRLSLVEAGRNGGAFVFRLYGSQLSGPFGISPTGRRHTEIFGPETAGLFDAEWSACLRAQEPRCNRISTDLFGMRLSYLELLLPLGESDPALPAHLLCSYTHLLDSHGRDDQTAIA
ncbi:MAG: PAS domain-containing protein [Azospirillum sp.]|nr:PAS domain-containing protein [Azospirillum sp.]